MRDHLLVDGVLGPDAVAELMGILGRALNKAVAQGLITRNVAAREFVDRPASQRRPFTVIDPALGRSLIDRVRDTAWDVPVSLALGTTLRREEILGLRWSDIDLDGMTINIRQAVTYAGGKVHVGEPKTSAGSREFSLPRFVCASLKRGRVEQNRRRLLLGEDWIDRDVVVDRGDGDYWVAPSFSTAWRRYNGKFDVEHVSLLGLRHGSATLMLAAGVPDAVAA
jgi:integrase